VGGCGGGQAAMHQRKPAEAAGPGRLGSQQVQVVQTDSGEILPATCEPGQAFTYASEDMHNDMYNISTAKCNQPTNQPGLRQCQHDF
jgi:hypothetical protein